MACPELLVGGGCVCVIVRELFSLEYNEVSHSKFWGVYGFSMVWEAHLLMFRVLFLFF